MVTEFYTKILELKGVEEFSRDKEISLTDGKVRLLIRPCNENLYRGMPRASITSASKWRTFGGGQDLAISPPRFQAA
jgi:hypothetical protein